MELKLVTYNDRYGNGNDTYIECVTDSFKKWLKKHNKEREEDGETPEGSDEFDVDEIEVILFKKKKK
jgi:hypothetical protein